MKFAVPARRFLPPVLLALLWAGSWGPARGDGPGPIGIAPAPLPLPPEVCPLKDPPAPVLRLKVRVPACAPPGQALRYHICVENCSPAEAHHVVVKDTVPANAKFVRADPEPTRAGPELQWHLGTVGGGACREITLVLEPTDQRDVKNCVRVQFEHGQCVVTRRAALGPGGVPLPPGTEPPGTEPPGAGEPPGGRPPKVTPVPPIRDRDEDLPRLSLTAEGHRQQYVNLPARYFLTVTNLGKTRATNLLVTATLPEKAKFERADAGGQFLERRVAWVFAGLDPGARRTVELVLSAREAGQWCVKAAARADLGAGAEGEACTKFVGTSGLTVDPKDRDDPLFVGTKTSYPIVVSNRGTAAVTDIRLRAFVPAVVRLEKTQPPEFQKGEAAAAGQWVQFAPLPKLDAGAQVTYELFVEAVRAGESRLRVEVTADQLEAGPLIEEENTTVVEEAPPGPPGPPGPG